MYYKIAPTIPQNLLHRFAQNSVCTTSACVVLVASEINRNPFFSPNFFNERKVREKPEKLVVKLQSDAIYLIIGFSKFHYLR